MKAQCPYCQAIYKVPDNMVGKSSKCKKCGQMFVISTLAPKDDPIGKVTGCPTSESASQPVQSNQATRSTPVLTENQNSIPSSCEITSQKGHQGWLPIKRVSKAGIAVSMLIILLAVQEFLVARWPEEYGPIDAGTLRNIENQKMILSYAILLTLSGPGTFLFIRSFKPGLNLWRGILTIVGGLLIGFVIAAVVYFALTLGTPARTWDAFNAICAFIFMFCLLLIPGLFIMRIGFRPKRGKAVQTLSGSHNNE